MRRTFTLGRYNITLIHALGAKRIFGGRGAVFAYGPPKATVGFTWMTGLVELRLWLVAIEVSNRRAPRQKGYRVVKRHWSWYLAR